MDVRVSVMLSWGRVLWRFERKIRSPRLTARVVTITYFRISALSLRASSLCWERETMTRTHGVIARGDSPPASKGCGGIVIHFPKRQWYKLTPKSPWYGKQYIIIILNEVETSDFTHHVQPFNSSSWKDGPLFNTHMHEIQGFLNAFLPSQPKPCTTKATISKCIPFCHLTFSCVPSFVNEFESWTSPWFLARTGLFVQAYAILGEPLCDVSAAKVVHPQSRQIHTTAVSGFFHLSQSHMQYYWSQALTWRLRARVLNHHNIQLLQIWRCT